MDVSVMAAGKWNLIFELLSLDGIVPLYQEMGLQLPDKTQFVEMLRQLIVESRQTFGPDRTPDISFANRVLEEIETTFGKETAEFFYEWATTVFYWVHEDQPQWSAWDQVLPRHPAQIPDGLPKERWDVISEFRKAHSIDDVEQGVRIVRSEPLSAWDSEMYSIHNYSNKEDPLCETDFIDPYSPVFSTIEMNRFQHAWPELWRHFSAEEKNLLWKYGRQRRKAAGVNKYDPGGLRHPDEMRRQI